MVVVSYNMDKYIFENWAFFCETSSQCYRSLFFITNTFVLYKPALIRRQITCFGRLHFTEGRGWTLKTGSNLSCIISESYGTLVVKFKKMVAKIGWNNTMNTYYHRSCSTIGSRLYILKLVIKCTYYNIN